MPAAKQLEGQVFGRLTVIERFRSRNGRVTWLCRCECGKLHEAVSNALTSGHTKSCGCWKDERNTSTAPTHGHASRKTGLSPTYQSWRGMWTRCTNPNVKSYKDYGGRGVRICDRWKEFENFLADMGERPAGRTLDRSNVNGNYEPSNCRWATRKEQAMNTQRASKLGDCTIPLYTTPQAQPLLDEMDAVASKYAHKLALDLECVLSDYNGRWWDTAMQTIGEYRSAMNRIHERESPTHMGEPVLPKHGITQGGEK